ncbi:hypothetical protein CRE_23330 [Caenorhabditis remanei]|uniref:Uncharacterized protein n=1 Tax=Caenorhabditis remanei TaxID=31234 RepID=E3MGW3_CAERE|nr:hypothetical protein CRE_23330 [Caenorhabditis remanei]
MSNWIERRVKSSIRTERFRFKRGHNLLDGIETVLIEKDLRPITDKGLFDACGQTIPYGILPENSILIQDYRY